MSREARTARARMIEALRLRRPGVAAAVLFCIGCAAIAYTAALTQEPEAFAPLFLLSAPWSSLIAESAPVATPALDGAAVLIGLLANAYLLGLLVDASGAAAARLRRRAGGRDGPPGGSTGAPPH